MSLTHYATDSVEYAARRAFGMSNPYKEKEPSHGMWGCGTWGSCCGMTLGLQHNPKGMSVAISTEKIEVFDKHPHPTRKDTHTISQEVVPIGDDHFLNLRYIQLIRKELTSDDYSACYGAGNTIRLAPCKATLPEVYSCGFGEFARQLKAGFYKDPVFAEPTKYHSTEDVWKVVRGWKDIYLSFAYSDDLKWRPGQKSLFENVIKPAGWEEKIVYHSPKFHNLLHASDMDRDYLRFVLIKL